MARPHSLAAVAKDRHSWWRYDRRRSTAICGTAVQRVADETKTKMARPKRSDLHLLLNYLMRYQAVIPAASFRVGRSVGRFIGRFLLLDADRLRCRAREPFLHSPGAENVAE